ALGAFVRDGHGTGVGRVEAKGAQRYEALVCRGRLVLLVDDYGFLAVGGGDGDRDIGGAVAVGRVGHADFVLAGGGDGELERGGVVAGTGAAGVVEVLLADEGLEV